MPLSDVNSPKESHSWACYQHCSRLIELAHPHERVHELADLVRLLEARVVRRDHGRLVRVLLGVGGGFVGRLVLGDLFAMLRNICLSLHVIIMIIYFPRCRFLFIGTAQLGNWVACLGGIWHHKVVCYLIALAQGLEGLVQLMDRLCDLWCVDVNLGCLGYEAINLDELIVLQLLMLL